MGPREGGILWLINTRAMMAVLMGEVVTRLVWNNKRMRCYSMNNCIIMYWEKVMKLVIHDEYILIQNNGECELEIVVT